MSQIYSLLPSPLGHTTGASLLSSVTVRCVPCPIHLSPQTVSLHKLMGDGSGSWSCRESNSGLACCQPLLAVTCVGVYPHLRGGRSSVDGCVRRTRTACRRCSCTGRANPSSDCPTSPIQSRVSRCEGETGRRNGVGVRSCGKVDDGCPCRPPARSKWFPAGYRKPVSPNDMGRMA